MFLQKFGIPLTKRYHFVVDEFSFRIFTQLCLVNILLEAAIIYEVDVALEWFSWDRLLSVQRHS